MEDGWPDAQLEACRPNGADTPAAKDEMIGKKMNNAARNAMEQSFPNRGPTQSGFEFTRYGGV
jgi:hypothetical protein